MAKGRKIFLYSLREKNDKPWNRLTAAKALIRSDQRFCCSFIELIVTLTELTIFFNVWKTKLIYYAEKSTNFYPIQNKCLFLKLWDVYILALKLD